jgi:copper chaperone CopZ
MKISKFIAVAFLAVFTFSACKTEVKKVQKETKEVKAENLQKIAFNISGMTCEIGCAKTIQSKLSKKAGIASAKVIFKDSLGLVEFDANAISKEDITAFVNGIAGGDLYKVNNAKSVTTFNEVAK